ncbi:hypothetical protein HZZ13_00390 [Bradyrhizobium sp. CNPSo 4010]|uniref:Alanine dehydrogenase/pyridine nucleotide transhydrogenase N-terminal domain-containing protein n=1 Tax=Bradyrhizobium agreste TaxID=2751811 RepID=A0ABS0PHD9_9BRAD|nr:hypothetical protein [Bradyrhizobium agreste]
MNVGVPKEIKTQEYRVGLTHGAVRECVAAGHNALVETRVGAGKGVTGDHYRKAGARRQCSLSRRQYARSCPGHLKPSVEEHYADFWLGSGNRASEPGSCARIPMCIDAG